MNTSTTTAPVARVLGSSATADGVHFGVWAPHADAVSVVGDFNARSRDAHGMERAEDGTWWAFVPGARPGHEYRFELRAGDQWLSRIDPRARAVTHSMGNGIICAPDFDWGNDAPVLHPWYTMVIYEMHVGTVGRAPDASAPATFADAVRVLDHLVRLGVTDVQLMPVGEFSGDHSWGYNPACPFAVERAYGGQEGLRAFVKEAHARGLGVILDVVYNHFGPDDLHLWRFDGWSEHDGGGIYLYNDHRASTPWGRTRPDYGRPEVRAFIRDNAVMWLEEYHVDGLRFDMTLYMRTVDGEGSESLPDGWSLAQWVNDEVQRLRPGAITIAEDLQDNDWLTKPTAEGGAGFGAQWDARFVHPVRQAVIAADDDHRSMHAVAEALMKPAVGDAFRRVIYSESHDEVANGKARVPHEIAGDAVGDWFAQKRSTLAAALVFTAPGIPMIFQGQEFLQGGWFRNDSALDWHQAEQYRGIVRLYRDLVAARRNLRGETPGLLGHDLDVYHLDDARNVLAFLRSDREDRQDAVMVAVNLGHQRLEDYVIGFPMPGAWAVRLNTDSPLYSETFRGEGPARVVAIDTPDDGLPATAALTLPAYSVLILSPEKA
ncbi:MAG: alpha amylase C-terminal domain-containing protein [Acidobacteria bacterium]|nr:alpha amylase C-terminal domain-containing protein [Acidobacteriota bacterium]